MRTKARLFAAAALVLWLAVPAFAHRLDQYLEATIVSVEKDGIHASMRLVPGVAVYSAVLASIDTNRDGVVSETEQRAYADRVLRDLSLTIDGTPVRAQLRSIRFPPLEQMKDGLGEIQLEFSADLPPSGGERRLVLENHHQRRIAAFLVNCLVPDDPDFRIVAQQRNEDQSIYELDFVQKGARWATASPWWWQSLFGFKDAVGFASIFRLGMRHIAEGTDHLLFLLALLLPAPLLVAGSWWGGFAGWRQSLGRILKVVTAFTAGHSITLAAAALGLVHVPSRPIEVLIALSILVSAAHALKPLFPGREAAIAAFFGLIHGLAFASTLGELGLGWRERVASILAFNLGIETMQLIVVVAVMPSLLILSRTGLYSIFRIGGALFAGISAAGWMGERLMGMRNPTNVLVAPAAHHATAIAIGLFLISVLSWAMEAARDTNQRHGVELMVPVSLSESVRGPDLV